MGLDVSIFDNNERTLATKRIPAPRKRRSGRALSLKENARVLDSKTRRGKHSGPCCRSGIATMGQPILSHNLIDCVRSGAMTYPDFRSVFCPMNHNKSRPFTNASTITVHYRSSRRSSLKLKLQTLRAGLLLLLCLASATASSQTYAILHTFNNNGDGTFPTGTLLASGQTLYGVTLGGGIPNHGTVFKVNTDGSG
jgi:uncharacterized repeat protein (TIGR03803 family)